MDHVTVSKTKWDEIQACMERLGLRDEDLVERFIRSSGPGGQNVNKVSTAVYLKHLPTGIEVKCQASRSQADNRFLARRLLLEKVAEKLLGEKSERQKKIWKMKKQKARRSRKAKEKILANKKAQSEKKRLRRSVKESE